MALLPGQSSGQPRRARCVPLNQPGFAVRPTRASPAQIRHEIPALVLDRNRTIELLQRCLGLLVAEIGGALVIGLGSIAVFRTAAPLLREGAHLQQRTRTIFAAAFSNSARAPASSFGPPVPSASIRPSWYC